MAANQIKSFPEETGNRYEECCQIHIGEGREVREVLKTTLKLN